MIEWVSLRWMEHVPEWAYVTTGFIAIATLSVIENREWLNFRSRKYFPVFLVVLTISWIGVVIGAYVQARNAPEPAPSPVIVDMQLKLAAALRERDIAISERDSARREKGDVSSASPIPPMPPSNGADEIAERIDAWKGIEASMSEVSDILNNEGDKLRSDWGRLDRTQIIQTSSSFVNKYENLRSRLQNLLNANNQFSDMTVIKYSETNKLSIYLTNLLN